MRRVLICAAFVRWLRGYLRPKLPLESCQGRPRREMSCSQPRAALITILIMNAPAAISPWDGWVSFFAPPLGPLHEQAQNPWLKNINWPYRFINDKQIYVARELSLRSWDAMHSFPPRGSWETHHTRYQFPKSSSRTFQIASSWSPSALHLKYRCCVGGDLLTRNTLKFLNSMLQLNQGRFSGAVKL